MPLITHYPSGDVIHIAPPLYHAELVPSRRRVAEHYARVVASLSPKQRKNLDESLTLLRRLLPLE